MGDTATAMTPTVFFSSGYEAVKPQFSRGPNPDGEGEVLIFTDIPVFRSGTFRNSMGEQNTWDDFHLAQMISNFEILQSRHIFERGPVRRGHGSFLTDPMTNLVGWVTSARTSKAVAKSDGNEYTYYLASGYIFEKDAMEYVGNGHWRNRSAEIGPYSTNDEMEVWPLLYGFAFVDIPAVEGLDAFGKSLVNAGKRLIADDPKEFSMSGTTPPVAPPAPPAAPQPPAAVETAPPAAPANPPAQGASTHTAPPPQLASFRINGTETSDYAAVQSHIAVLEAFRTEAIQTGRSDFISSLVTSGKITGPQAEAFSKLVLGDEESGTPPMTDAQFKAFKAPWEVAAPVQVLGNHGQSSGVNSSQNGGAVESPEAEEIKTLQGQVEMHRRTGMTEDKIQQLPSFKRLTALQAAAN
jgi:hypothetical protein